MCRANCFTANVYIAEICGSKEICCNRGLGRKNIVRKMTCKMEIFIEKLIHLLNFWLFGIFIPSVYNGEICDLNFIFHCRVKLLYTLKMFPNLQADLLKEFGITVQGFYPGSSELILSGNRPEPYLKITGILNHQNILMCTCIGLLIQSAQKRISLEKLPAVLCAHGQNKGDFCYAEVYSNSLSQITLLICGPDDVPQKVSTIINSPEQKEVILANANAIQVIKGLPQCNFVQLLHHYGVYIQENVHRPSLVVQGYVQEEVMAVFSILSGAATSVAASVNTVVPVLPSFTHTEKFQYHCHPNFKSQIQEHVVDTLQQQLRVAILFFDSDVMTQYSPAKPVSESGGKAKKVVITLLLQSNFEEDFSDACGKLKVCTYCSYACVHKCSKKYKRSLLFLPYFCL